MTFVTTASPATATSTTCDGSGQYELPVKDAACGVPNIKNYQSLFDNCAKPAGSRPYYHDCALWGLAVDQSVQDLTDCLYKAGVAWEDVWCHGDTNGTATATSYPTPTATGTSTSTGKKSGTSSTLSSTSETNMAISSQGQIPTKIALGLLGLVLTGVFV
ncbi:uncharacterized protein EURHEDRAFT_405548 [Aspergillus ruber CBS 135680]|uniref:Uncharacterized protein n=1 Tax=Aspergillus ruber (strain CBS 135680) TaxID=1388766 RepID=A0A017S4U1_ASPRC|nr:uncharacterized protein EURHEDRAFT_405548 [Aspergillus ruber CBS 135680]EYE91871.1 hypothetical protein EURHEDRAFT_405548 [Aspergillus ruber CBS 135680]